MKRVAIQVNVDPYSKDKINRPYNLKKAFSEQDVLSWNGDRLSLKNVEKDDFVYLCLSKPFNNKIMYKCVVKDVIVDSDSSSKSIYDSEYFYNPLTREEKIEKTSGTSCLLEKIKYSDDNKLCMENLKNEGLTNATHIQGSIRDIEHAPFFDYIDKIFDEESNIDVDIEADFKNIIKESIGIPEKYRNEYIKVRIGQSKFREALIKKHGCKCAICKMNIKELLIASHIKEYSKCEKNEHIDVQNGLLLCPNHDKLFDRHLISFLNNGKIIISEKINLYNYKILKLDDKFLLDTKLFKEEFMKFHRKGLV
ncbi:HNH endonuclease [Clostridium estertheticum]|uniref:HNH endonuclease n=1 Tax=Clostridium estertheticum TaxID=238834 RepID=UPI001C6E2136|nr:HNH endonuclease [Clostridium estertheticum]MBW9169758.1 HNH endonuclease [Clostridium estertheticum]WLC74736.1 HNH endonuclease [Clostridium estertheticum]